MFTINISFKDALTCFEALSHHKPKEDLKSIESEFVKYAHYKAQKGDGAAAAWLKNNKPNAPDDISGGLSPMRFFAGMERPAKKDYQLNLLEKKNKNKNNTDVLLSVLDMNQIVGGADKEKKYVEAKKAPITRKSIESAMQPLNDLVGLGKVKKHVRRILDGKIIEQRRLKAGLKVSEATSNHMVFTGNPGTGKTTVARLVSGIFAELGFLSKGHLTEVSRSDLIGEFIGQTEQIVKDVLESAHGGVLFIDEAYNLHKPSSQNDYGQDVISILMKHMEDHRDNLIVIMAGYAAPMHSFLRSNPGLKSRIPHNLEFEDMGEEHLGEVFKALCREHDYVLDADAEKVLIQHLKEIKRKDLSEFPNGRGVRNLFEEVIRRQSERILEQNLRAKKKLALIMAEDIPTSRSRKNGNVVQLPRD